jgi:ADP-ribosylglycohydrolase
MICKTVAVIINDRTLKMTYTEIEIRSALFGVAVGDALGVPVEFNSRQTIAENPLPARDFRLKLYLLGIKTLLQDFNASQLKEDKSS